MKIRIQGISNRLYFILHVYNHSTVQLLIPIFSHSQSFIASYCYSVKRKDLKRGYPSHADGRGGEFKLKKQKHTLCPFSKQAKQKGEKYWEKGLGQEFRLEGTK